YYFHQATDISLGGLFLAKKIISKDTRKGTYKFKLPNSPEVITVEGEAVYDTVKFGIQKKTGSGIRFTNLKPEDKEIISDYIEGNRFKT
ncbi:PilZ domain-containing protein, partial [Bdellovibrionota bacterium]